MWLILSYVGSVRSDKSYHALPTKTDGDSRGKRSGKSPVIQTQALVVFLSNTLVCISNASVHWLSMFCFLPSMTRQKKYGTIHEKKTIKNRTQENRNKLNGSLIDYEKCSYITILSDHFNLFISVSEMRPDLRATCKLIWTGFSI